MMIKIIIFMNCRVVWIHRAVTGVNEPITILAQNSEVSQQKVIAVNFIGTLF